MQKLIVTDEQPVKLKVGGTDEEVDGVITDEDDEDDDAAMNAVTEESLDDSSNFIFFDVCLEQHFSVLAALLRQT